MSVTTVLAAICRSAIVDRQTNALSMIELFEELNPQSIPLLLPQLTVVWILRREMSDPSRMDAELQLRLNGNSMGTFPVRVDFETGRHTRAIVAMQGVVLTEPGELSLDFLIGNERLARQSTLISAPSVTTAPAIA